MKNRKHKYELKPKVESQPVCRAIANIVDYYWEYESNEFYIAQLEGSDKAHIFEDLQIVRDWLCQTKVGGA